MKSEEEAANTLDLLFWKDSDCFLFLPQAFRWPKARGILVVVVIFANHFLINTETRTFCLPRLELRSQILLLGLAEGRPESEVVHGGPRKKLMERPSAHVSRCPLSFSPSSLTRNKPVVCR